MVDPTVLAIGADPDTSSTDIAFGGQGDPLMVAGLAQYHQRIARLLVMGTDDLLGSPGIGGGVLGLLGQPLTDATRADAEARVQAVITADPATDVLMSLDLSRPTIDTLLIDAVVLVLGGPPVPLTWSL